MDRSLRLLYIQHLFYKKPRGYKASELARLCGVDPRTINRDLQDLQDEPFRLPLVTETDWRWRLMKGHRFTLPPIHFSLQEAAALYLAAWLLDRISDEPNPFVVRALVALADALPAEIGHVIHEMVADRIGEERSPFAHAFEVVTLGWATGRKVRMRYRSLHSEEIRDTVLEPYLVAPSWPSHAVYVIGYASHAGEVRTFKMERILDAELLEEAFTVPERFDAVALLKNAWGIMWGEDTQEVVLRFTPAVAQRVRESRWHKTQETEDCDDGGCIARFRVAHPGEMKSWILGWGPDCEVLAPESLRASVADALQRAARLYSASASPGPDPARSS